MALNYKEDKYLEFLQDQDNANLDVLVKLLIYDKNGKKRHTEELSSSVRYTENPRYPKEYWDLIVAEYRKFGGNSLINIFRSEGASYETILKDVCRKMKVKFTKNTEIIEIEQALFLKIIEDTFEHMTDKEREDFLRDLNIEVTDFTKQASIIAMQTAIRSSGFMAYKLAVIIANTIAKQLVGHGLKFAANAGLVRAIGVFAGPLGWAITGAWTVIDLSGPAYRVTIPATIYIAALRQAELNKNYFEIHCLNCNELIVNRKINTCENCGGEYR